VQKYEFISRDEGLHRDFACLLYNTLQHRLDETRVFQIVMEAVDHEIEFVCEALKVRLLGMNDQLMSQYIRVVADSLLISLGYSKLYGDENPFSFMELQSLQGKTNFFEGRPTEYQLAGIASSGEGIQVGGARVFSMDEDF